MNQVVTQSSQAVTVTDVGQILIGWTNIELFSGFILYVNNVGGGEGTEIADVLIDTSNDGGATSQLDRHAGVPTVPITAGWSGVGTFTETAKFIRVRAATGESDTTATALLIATASKPVICTLDDAKTRLGISDTKNDTLLTQIITGVEGIFNIQTGRTLIASTLDVTEYYTGGSPYLSLKRYPVISVTSIKEAVDYDFDNATALTVNTDYRLIAGGKKGIIYKPYYCWLDTPDCIQVMYRGGYCAAGVTPAAGEYALPADLREAAIMQSCFFYKRKDDIGLSSVSFDGTSFSKFSPMDLLPIVKETLENYTPKPWI